MDYRAFKQIDDYRTDLPGIAAFAHEISAIPALAHLATYAFDKLPTFMSLVNATTDLATLTRMAADPNTPAETLLFLAGICPVEFCTNPVLPLLLLENPNFPMAFEAASLGRLLSYEAVPSDLLALLARFGHSDMAQAARLHIGLQNEAGADWRVALAEAILQLPLIPEDDLLAVLLVLGTVPSWLHERIGLSFSPRIAQALAVARGESSDLTDLAQSVPSREPPHSARSLEVLLDMIEDDSAHVRALAARDPRLPSPVLANLKVAEDWSDSDIGVYESIASNPSTPAQTLHELASNPSAIFTGVRRAVALNPSASAEALAVLVNETYADDIRLILAAHPNLLPEVRERIRDHALDTARQLPDPFHRTITLHHSTVTDDLQTAAYSPFWIERLAVALNPYTPRAIRTLLANDGNWLVRSAALDSVMSFE